MKIFSSAAALFLKLSVAPSVFWSPKVKYTYAVWVIATVVMTKVQHTMMCMEYVLRDACQWSAKIAEV